MALVLFCVVIPRRAQAAPTPPPIRCAIPKDVLTDMKLFLSGRSALSVTNYGGKHARRDVAEAILVQQIFVAGGSKRPIKWIEVESYQRVVQLLTEGAVDCTATTMWLEDIHSATNKVIASPALIPMGEFEAGFYTVVENERAMAAKTAGDLRELSAVSNRNWKPDWLTLKKLKVRQVFHTPSWETMPRMVKHKRADFTLAPFQPTADLGMNVADVELHPIPGLKVGLEGSRHIAFSKARAQKDLQVAFSQGLKTLNDQGIIKQAYRECGFINPMVADWKNVLDKPGPVEPRTP